MNMSVSQADMQGLVNRLARLAKLDTSVFDEVRLDSTASVTSMIVAAVSVVLMGVGGWLWWVIASDANGGGGDIFVKSTILGSVFAFALWIAWVFIVYVLLTQIFRAQADVQQLIRVMGLAAVPLGLMVLMFIPEISMGIGIAALALAFGLTVIATMSATSASAGQVLAANAIGFAVFAIVLTLLAGDRASSMYTPGVFIFGLLS